MCIIQAVWSVLICEYWVCTVYYSAFYSFIIDIKCYIIITSSFIIDLLDLCLVTVRAA